MRVRRLALAGCGLMGGSFALALRRAGLVERIVGCGTSPASLEPALRLGVIDEVADGPAAAARGADVVLLAVPVAATAGAGKAPCPPHPPAGATARRRHPRRG